MKKNAQNSPVAVSPLSSNVILTNYALMTPAFKRVEITQSAWMQVKTSRYKQNAGTLIVTWLVS